MSDDKQGCLSQRHKATVLPAQRQRASSLPNASREARGGTMNWRKKIPYTFKSPRPNLFDRAPAHRERAHATPGRGIRPSVDLDYRSCLSNLIRDCRGVQ
jgi:hypothetical protein